MIDRSFTNPAAMIHLPDVRLTDISTRIEVGKSTLDVELEAPDRAILIYALKGRFEFEIDGDDRPPMEIREGTAVGLQRGLKNRWKGVSGRQGFELFISSIRRTAGPLQGLDHEVIVVPPNAKPSSTIIRHAVAIYLTEYRSNPDQSDSMVIRRCAEIMSAELARFAQRSIVDNGAFPRGIAHDEYLLRAWTAYYAAPRDRWTVQSLANAAGLGRTAFSNRFRKAVGVPPLTAITDLRLDNAIAMLREKKAPLIEIAFTSGYNSEAAFVRAFSRKFGIPPGRFKQTG